MRKEKEVRIGEQHQRGDSFLCNNIVDEPFPCLSSVWSLAGEAGQRTGNIFNKKNMQTVFIVDKNRHRYAKRERNPSGNTHCQKHKMENYNELTTEIPWLKTWAFWVFLYLIVSLIIVRGPHSLGLEMRIWESVLIIYGWMANTLYLSIVFFTRKFFYA